MSEVASERKGVNYWLDKAIEYERLENEAISVGHGETAKSMGKKKELTFKAALKAEADGILP